MKILYLNHICWEWIFQRPQILGLMLEDDFDCTILNKRFILGKTVAHKNIRPKHEKKVWLLPRQNKYKFIHKCNQILYDAYVSLIALKYDAIWVCHPSLYSAIPKKYKGKVIYDCMDNHVALAEECDKQYIKDEEAKLIKRADLKFATSMKLTEVLEGMRDATLVRNGYLTDVLSMNIKVAQVKETYVVGYFGTVASWFDFDLLKSCVRGNNRSIIYQIIGPYTKNEDEVTELETHNIYLKGMVEHNKLADYVKEYDALIMPFVVNDIILSVDPVKLYEYINLGKCIISVWYPEIDRFEPFVYFYHNLEEYNKLMHYLCETGFPPKYTDAQREDFLKESTWEEKYKTIKMKIMELEEK